MRFLIVRTDIRAAADDELAAAWAQGECLRDEQTTPEQRRQVVRAEDRDAALLLARALSSVGAVRSGRQRVKVLPVGEPPRRHRADALHTGSHGTAVPADELTLPPTDLTPRPTGIGPQPDPLAPGGPRPAHTGPLGPRLGLPT